jgi:hypothetical protein
MNSHIEIKEVARCNGPWAGFGSEFGSWNGWITKIGVVVPVAVVAVLIVGDRGGVAAFLSKVEQAGQAGLAARIE